MLSRQPLQEEVGPSGAPSDAPFGLVCLHGFNGSVFSFRNSLGPLAASFPGPEAIRVIAFDRCAAVTIFCVFAGPREAGVRQCTERAALVPMPRWLPSARRPPFGLTSRPLTWGADEPNPYSTEGYVKLSLGLLDALGLKPGVSPPAAGAGGEALGGRVVLLGHSAGAQVVMQVALAAPERVAGVVLVSPAIPASDAKEDSFIGKAVRHHFPTVKPAGPFVNSHQHSDRCCA